jgi:hypothetical protein
LISKQQGDSRNKNGCWFQKYCVEQHTMSSAAAIHEKSFTPGFTTNTKLTCASCPQRRLSTAASLCTDSSPLMPRAETQEGHPKPHLVWSIATGVNPCS